MEGRIKMPKYGSPTIIFACLLLVFFYGCSKGTQTENAEGAHTHESEEAGHTHGEEAGEHTHDEEGGHTHDEGEEHSHEHGEESGQRIPLDSTYDETWHGIRLVLAYDSKTSSFVGTMVNVTEEALSKVRVEVHLSNGVELGPTKPVDMAPGEKVEIKLPAEGQEFDWWKAHPETGDSEH